MLLFYGHFQHMVKSTAALYIFCPLNDLAWNNFSFIQGMSTKYGTGNVVMIKRNLRQIQRWHVSERLADVQ